MPKFSEPMLRVRSWTRAQRERVALGSAAMLLLGGVLLVEHEASEHNHGAAACAVCLSTDSEGLSHVVATPRRITVAATPTPRAKAQAVLGDLQLPKAIRAPPNSPNA